MTATRFASNLLEVQASKMIIAESNIHDNVYVEETIDSGIMDLFSTDLAITNSNFTNIQGVEGSVIFIADYV